MELKEFITETISQISQGISEAGKIVENTNINPHCEIVGGFNGIVPINPVGSASLLKFKIELCRNEESGEKSGIGVFFANMGIGFNDNSTNKISSLTSVEFSLPVEFPHVYNEH